MGSVLGTSTGVVWLDQYVVAGECIEKVTISCSKKMGESTIFKVSPVQALDLYFFCHSTVISIKICVVRLRADSYLRQKSSSLPITG